MRDRIHAIRRLLDEVGRDAATAGTRQAAADVRRALDALARTVEVEQTIERIRDSVVNVLITGETGIARQAAARAIHQRSPWSGKGFVVVAPPAPIEDVADGALFLDDVAELGATAQAALLRMIEERGADVRVIAGTAKELEAEIAKGSFREDLYYRIRVVHIDLPSAPAARNPDARHGGAIRDAIERLEREMVADALEATKGNQQRAAKKLGLSRQGLINKIKRYGLA